MRYSFGFGVVYAIVATAGVFLYLAISKRGTERDSLGPPAIVLLSNPRPEEQGKPRTRREGRLVWSNADGVGLCVDCNPRLQHRRILELPRRRPVWVRVHSKDAPAP